MQPYKKKRADAKRQHEIVWEKKTAAQIKASGEKPPRTEGEGKKTEAE